MSDPKKKVLQKKKRDAHQTLQASARMQLEVNRESRAFLNFKQKASSKRNMGWKSQTETCRLALVRQVKKNIYCSFQKITAEWWMNYDLGLFWLF